MRKCLIKIHPLTIFFLFIALITGYFRYVIYMMSLIFFHELGHTTIALIFNYEIDSIVLLPFGGVSKFKYKLNDKIYKEVLVTLFGPIYQILFYLLLVKLGYKTELLSSIHYFLLFFNLLPIYPLDGSKLCLSLFFKLTSFYKSYIYIVITSLLFLIFYFLLNNTFLNVVLVIFLLYKIYDLYKNKGNIFNKFLLERYLYDFNFKKIKLIKKLKQMKREYRHKIIVNNMNIEEKDFLTKYFSEKP